MHSSKPSLREARRRGRRRPAKGKSDLVAIHTEQVAVEEPREAGPVHVGHQMWKKLGVDEVLARAGLSARARVLREIMNSLTVTL